MHPVFRGNHSGRTAAAKIFNRQRHARSCADIDTEMKYIVAALYSHYSTTVVDDTGIEQSDAYTAPPEGDRLLIRLKTLETGAQST